MASAVDATTHPQPGPPMSVADIYANARALAGYLKEKSAEIDAARRLPPEVAARLRGAGMFRLMMPKAWGGPRTRPHRAGRSDRGTRDRQRLGGVVRNDRMRLRIFHRLIFSMRPGAKSIRGSTWQPREASSRAGERSASRRKLMGHRSVAVRLRYQSRGCGRAYLRALRKRRAAYAPGGHAGDLRDADAGRGGRDDPGQLAYHRHARDRGSDYRVKDLFVPERFPASTFESRRIAKGFCRDDSLTSCPKSRASRWGPLAPRSTTLPQ